MTAVTPGNGQRCFGDVGRDDDRAGASTARSARSCASASRDPWSGDDVDVASGQLALNVGHGPANLGRARKKTEDVAVVSPPAFTHSAAASATDCPGAYATSTGCSRPGTSMTGQPSRNADTAPASIVADITTMRRSSPVRRAHLARRLTRCQPAAQRDGDVGVDAALVKFVEDDRPEIGQQRIALQPGGQDAFGDDEQPGVGAESPIEADLPADLAADRPSTLGCNPRRDRACGDPSGLKKDDRAVGASAGGTRVVLPAPGAAVTTTARERRAASRIASMNGSIGRVTMDVAPELVESRAAAAADTRACALGRWASRVRSDADRTAHAGAAEAAVAVGVLGEVLLVVVLGVVELRAPARFPS